MNATLEKLGQGIIQTGEGIKNTVFNQAAAPVENTKVGKGQVTTAAKNQGSDQFINQTEFKNSQTKKETAVVKKADGEVASEEQVDKTWEQTAQRIQKETEKLKETSTMVKTSQEKLTLGGKEQVKTGNTEIEINDVSTTEQIKKVEKQIEDNKKIISNANGQINLQDSSKEAQNKDVIEAYNNLNKIRDELIKPRLESLNEEDSDIVDAITQLEEAEKAELKRLNKKIEDFYKNNEATILLANGSHLTNNSIKYGQNTGIKVDSDKQTNLDDRQVAISYKNNQGKDVFHIVDRGDKYTSITKETESGEIANGIDNDELFEDAVAFKNNGEPIDLGELENGEPVTITAGKSLSIKQIEEYSAPVHLNLSNSVVVPGKIISNDNHEGSHTPQHFYTFELNQDQLERLIVTRAGDTKGVGRDAQWLNEAYEYGELNTESENQEKTFGTYDLVTKIRNPDGSFSYKLELSEEAYRRFNNT